MSTGIFFHYQRGESLKDFPQALAGILNRENVFFYGVAMAIHELREKRDVHRFAIIDTDAHHEDGTWELFK